VAAERYVDGTLMQCIRGKAWLRRGPAANAPVETEILFGEMFTAYEVRDGYAWGQARLDGYVGYVQADSLSSDVSPPTHRVTASSTFRFSEPNLKSAVLDTLPLNAVLAMGEGAFAELAGGGFVFSGHVQPIDRALMGWVDVAERFVGVPYLWGGRSPLGFDCSGLVQAALLACGATALRDADMQEQSLGQVLGSGTDLQALRRGDLVFWNGHVGIMQSAERLLHANAFHMAVASEPLPVAVERIEAAGQTVSSIRRIGP
jgi:cell wall-associated NlpC family hydrolase